MAPPSPCSPSTYPVLPGVPTGRSQFEVFLSLRASFDDGFGSRRGQDDGMQCIADV